MKKYFIIAAVSIAAGVLIFNFTDLSTLKSGSWAPETKEREVSQTAPPEDALLITITEEAGFTPKEVTINLGDTVTFRNDDDEGHWPASDLHPSHEVYPAFDPKRSIPPGESWSFTFDKPGVWRMHDHEYPIFEGTITVIDPKAPTTPETPTITNTPCDLNGTDFYCIEEHYKKMVKEQGIPAAMKDLQTRYEASAYVRSQCHPITHVIGRAAVALYPRVSEAYKHGNALCWSGYYHGVMEGIIAKIGKANILGQMATICNDIEGRESYNFDYYNCVHGLGHGLMALTNNELFEALDLCDNLIGGWEQTSCYGGAFMENVIVDNKNHFTKYLWPYEPLYPCTAVTGPRKQSCYLMHTSYMLKVNNNDFAKVFPLCRIVDAGYEATCFQSLGRDASGQSISDAVRTKAICDMGANDMEKSNCLIGAVKDFISYHHSDVQARELCAMFPENLKAICNDTTTSYYATF